MLWRLSPSVRSLYALNCRRFNSTAAKAKTKTADPLRILFCGSDKFSSASLRRLAQAKNEDPSLIESIDVVHRPGKPAGSSQKRIKEVPIKQVATEELQLPTHILDTFTGWTPPISYNLIVVVSFGLKVPPRIINLAKYQGINVHPSLLPDLSGPAPIPHTILKHRPFAGITVQTLHPEKFDGGIIVAQTPRPGIKYDKEADLRELTELLSEKGADMLIDVLKSRAFVPPVEDVGWYANSGRPIAHADKIEKQDAFIDFSKNTLDEIMSIHRSGSFPWTKLP
ncbi:Formyltransferase, partial [Massarina eburnea CBS 473.64]